MPTIYEPSHPVPGASAPVPAPHARHAENADARMGIRHDEEKQEQKKRNRDPSDLTLPEDVYDQTTLGVRALIDFLKKFLQTLAVSETIAKDPTVSLTQIQTDTDRTGQGGGVLPVSSTPMVNQRAAMAAQAYGRTEHVHAATTSGQISEADPSSALLQSSEIRQIHELLEKLNRLDRQGAVGLKLEKAGTFVQSLMNAADHALSE